MSALKPAIVVFLACDLVLGGVIIWFIDRPLFVGLFQQLNHALGVK